MTTRDTPWPDGTPCWADLGAQDIAKARAFYSDVLSWTVQPGGPVTVVSGPRAPSAISLSICGRPTAQAGTLGIVILEVRTGSSAPLAWALERPPERAPVLVTIFTSAPAGPVADRTFRTCMRVRTLV